MTEEFCAPFAQCTELDGRLVIRQTLQGPPLAQEDGLMPFGALAVEGSTLRPYLDLDLTQTWTPREACYGPVRSVLGLAPGETITTTVTNREQVDFTSLVRRATTNSEASATERTFAADDDDDDDDADALDALREARRASDEAKERRLAGLLEDLAELRRKEKLSSLVSLADAREDAEVQKLKRQKKFADLAEALGEDDAVSLLQKIIDKWGSAYEGPSSTVGQAPAATTALGIGDAIVDAIGHSIAVEPGAADGTPPAIVAEMLDGADAALSRIQASESNSMQSEETRTTRRSLERTVVRTFTNPYRDRSVQLRFIPVFRRFEVGMAVSKATAGLVVTLGKVSAQDLATRNQLTSSMLAAAGSLRASRATGRQLRRHQATMARSVDLDPTLATRGLVYEARLNGGIGLLQQPLARMLDGGRSARTRTRSTGPRPTQALSWSNVKARGNSIFVPLARPVIAADALRLTGQARSRFLDSLAALAPESLVKLSPKGKARSVHLFIGTHVEVVPGSCVLPDVPPVAPA